MSWPAIRRRCFSSLRPPSSSSSSSLLSWKSTGKLQQTLASEIHKSGITLHSGITSTVKLSPALAGQGRFFVICGCDSNNNSNSFLKIPASIDFVSDTFLSTTLTSNCRTTSVRTVEHLLSALEATGVDNCQIHILPHSSSTHHHHHEVPLLDGSAKQWVDAIQQVGFSVAKDCNGNTLQKLAPFLLQPLHVSINDSFIFAFPSQNLQITCGINFPQVPAIGCQWFSAVPMDDFCYKKEIASSRTFCIHEEVERMFNAGLIQGGSTENAIVCSVNKGWLNPPLRFQDEPCRHKVLDLVGDLSLLAQNGNQGLPAAHIISYKGGHTLHAKFVRHLSGFCQVEN